jgi:SHS2 domain-containing protein
MTGVPGFLPFEAVDHTADLAYVVRGRTLSALFENAAAGLLHFLADPCTVRPVEEDWIEVEGDDVEELLVSWLQEILYRLEVGRRLYREFRVTSIEVPRLRAIARGETLDPSRHVIQTDIKAATYHQLRITREDSPAGTLYRTMIVLDI